MLSEYAKVCYELLRPQQIKQIKEQDPIVYIPAGSLEWHGRHNPLGTDSLKAHAICCEAALMYGGVVIPAYYLGLLGNQNWGPSGWEGYTLGFNDHEVFQTAMCNLSRALVNAGWKVLVGVTGHDVPRQRDRMGQAIASETNGTSSVGFAVMEGELHSPDAELPWKMDHAGAWETSCMLYAYPEAVDLYQLESSPMADAERLIVDWDARDFGVEGIDGYNPYKFATKEMGQVIIKRMATLIGKKASAMLAQLQE